MGERSRRLTAIEEQLSNLRQAYDQAGDQFGVPRDDAVQVRIASEMKPLEEERDALRRELEG